MDELKNCNLNSCIFFTLSKLSRGLDKKAKEEFKKTGLSPSHAFLLYIVAKNKEFPQQEIGNRFNLDPSTVTRLVSKLKNKNLITKSKKGKKVYLSITKKGVKLKSDIVDSWDNLAKAINNSLSAKEKSTYLTLTKKILKNLEKE
ncbi:MAG: MarR family winged helix-turn-helix transcriptional regulator [Bacillota bacterium]